MSDERRRWRQSLVLEMDGTGDDVDRAVDAIINRLGKRLGIRDVDWTIGDKEEVGALEEGDGAPMPIETRRPGGGGRAS